MKVPLKTVLKNFLDHVYELEVRRTLDNDRYEEEFQELKKLTDNQRDDPIYSSSCGLKDVNRPKNRYKDIVPYDFSRVVLPKYEGIPGSDYINASYIKGATGAFAYIAAQGPLPNTVMDFWRMIWICDVQVLVMACNEYEGGKFKCEKYWPEKEVKCYGNISVELIDTSQVCPDFLMRTLLVKCDSEMRDVYQFHYTTWPDHGIPDTVFPILDLVRLVRECQASETVPILIHCSAGCGRTGTICAIDYVWACLRQGKLDESFSLFDIAVELRKQRIAMIQTKEQYILAHKAVARLFEQQLTLIDCHPYVNVDEDGEPVIWKEFSKQKEIGCSKDSCEATNSNEESKEGLLIQNKSVVGPTHVGQDENKNLRFINMQDQKGDALSKSVSSNNSKCQENNLLFQPEDNIPFIDEDEVHVRPICGRAYLDLPSCDSITKLVNCFDPFVDKVFLGSDDSSPDGNSNSSSKTLDIHWTSPDVHCNIKAKDETFSQDSNTLSHVYPEKKLVSYANQKNVPSLTTTEIDCKDLSRKPPEMKCLESDDQNKVTESTQPSTVTPKPSISKIRALFEKSSILGSKSSSDGSKRLLFRNNSHHVPRAGSAPPSLDCMDRQSSAEKESILMMVTKKFRSSSVRTEREVNARLNYSSRSSKSSSGKTSSFRDGFNSLTRTVSFNLSKTFKSQSTSKTKVSNSKSHCSSEVPEVGNSENKKGNSMWYDKSSLPRIRSKTTSDKKLKTETSDEKQSFEDSEEDNRKQDSCLNYVQKPQKFLPFLKSLNRNEVKEPSTMWYGGMDSTSESVKCDRDEVTSTCENVKTPASHKTLPFLPSLSSWKKVSPKSPLSPGSLKNFFEFNIQADPNVCNSKFYANIEETEHNSSHISYSTPLHQAVSQDETVRSSFVEPQMSTDSTKNISVVMSKTEHVFLPHDSPVASESVTPKLPETEIIPSTSTIKCTEIKELNMYENVNKQKPIEEAEKGIFSNNTLDKTLLQDVAKETMKKDIPPAIPRKQIIGKSKNLNLQEISLTCKNHDYVNIPEQCVAVSEMAKNISCPSALKSTSEKDNKSLMNDRKNDVYSNVNIKAIQNIQQIENTLRKNPRGAIIDLTSRESYSMEEELVNAVKQLSEIPKENKTFISDGILRETKRRDKAFPVMKSNSKFPGYEVIWPEEKESVAHNIQKSHSSSRIKGANLVEIGTLKQEPVISYKAQTGLCHSPPLRRSIGSGLGVSKSQSCGNLDWLDTDDSILSKDINSDPPGSAKSLVKEAVVELNTLLNHLTSKTLTENTDINSDQKKIQSPKIPSVKQINAEASSVHSVTLLTKSCISCDSPKEEEIIFHFPPPPPVPPPVEEDIPCETFNVVCKDGSVAVLNEKAVKKSSTSDFADNTPKNSANNCPLPAPRKSKFSCGLQRSASYSTLYSTTPGDIRSYENVLLEKYQTLNQLKDQRIISDKKDSGNIFINTQKQKEIKPCVNIESKDAKKVKNQRLNDSISSSKHFPLEIPNKTVESQSKFINNSNFSEQFNVKRIDFEKKKLIPSKKIEHAPLPPVKQSLTPNKNSVVHIDSNSISPKKPPSKKLVKAPPPPLLASKNISEVSLGTYPNGSNNNNNSGVENYSLPAVHENIPEDVIPIYNKKNKSSSSAVRNYGLSHSQSDVSVFLALKKSGHHLKQKQKASNKTALYNQPWQPKETVNNYEQIFCSKSNDEPRSNVKQNVECQKDLSHENFSKHETPVAPPRSRRRSTVEVKYSKVNPKDASLKLPSDDSVPDSKENSSDNNEELQEMPPAIPSKTKDAFELLNVACVRDHKEAV